jgi:hypothetical protein
MSSLRRSNLMNNFFKASKTAVNGNQYNKNTGKQVESVSTIKNNKSPHKLDLNVVSSIQKRKDQDQESSEYEAMNSRSHGKANKFKGKARFNKSNPRNIAQRGASENSNVQRKRSAKREFKESEEEHDHTAFCEKSASPAKLQNTVNFENSKLKETLVSRKRSKAPKMAEVEAGNQRENRSCALPPKSEAEKLLDQQWTKDLPREVTEGQKDYLLSLNNQAERNRELSRITGTEEEVHADQRSSLAVLGRRKSHVPKTQNRGKFYRYASGGR